MSPEAVIHSIALTAVDRLPLWIPENDPQEIGFQAISMTKAQAAGLTFRPLADTVRDTLAWTTTFPPAIELQAGLKSEQEQHLLQSWHDR